MAEGTEKTGRTKETTAEAGYEALIRGNQDNLSAAVKANETMFNDMMAVGREIMDFASSRLEQDLAVTEKLMKSKDAESAFRVQCEFAQTAIQQYFEESQKLMALGTNIARDCWTPLQDQTSLMLRGLRSD